MTSQGAKDAAADAGTLVVNGRPRYGSALYVTLEYGSKAVVAVLDGEADLAGYYAQVAAHAARRAVRGLR